jgi:hypothetical protein
LLRAGVFDQSPTRAEPVVRELAARLGWRALVSEGGALVDGTIMARD